MPLGDPHGGEFTYTNEGLPSGIAAAIIPCRDFKTSFKFYTDLLKMEFVEDGSDYAILKNGNEYFILRNSPKFGVDTGICLRLDSPYELHKRLVDEGVVFVNPPEKTRLGLMMSFKDFDENIIHGVEIQI